VELTKNVQGLGITIAGYIGDKKLGNLKPKYFLHIAAILISVL